MCDVKRKLRKPKKLVSLESLYKEEFSGDFSLGNRPAPETPEPTEPQEERHEFGYQAQANAAKLQALFHADRNQDFTTHEVLFRSQEEEHKAYILFLKTVTDLEKIEKSIVHPLQEVTIAWHQVSQQEWASLLLRQINAQCISTVEKARDSIVAGCAILFLPGVDQGLVFDVANMQGRAIQNPEVENVIRGPHEGFVESLDQNVGLVRKNLPSEHLIVEYIEHQNKFGRHKSAILYLEGFTNPKLVDEVKRRLTGIDQDILINSGVLQQLMEDEPWSLVPTLTTTERPDRVCGLLSDGHVIVMASNTPYTLICPTTFWTLFHTAEETYLRMYYGNFIRLIRVFACFLALFSPGIYMALTNFQPEMLPSDLMLHIAGSREMLPFPTIVEILLMEISFELIYEAGTRLPRAVGSTIGIVGALILGQAAVQANLISPLLVILVSITGLGSFAIPNQDLSYAIRIARFLFLALGGTLGFFGISLGIVFVGGYLVSLKSFGVPFLAPLYPRWKANWDFVFRTQIWLGNHYNQSTRPRKKRKSPNSDLRNWAHDEEKGDHA